jgi:BlaI family transcriptional regulator, penicillinase repressor
LTYNYLGSITTVVKDMAKRKTHRLGDLQLRIMQVLWRGESTVAEVFADISRERDLAYTTIATMLRKMEARGLVTHRAEGRTFIYKAAIDSHSVTSNMSDHLLDRLFEGSLADLVCHLLETREVSRDELVRIEKLIAQRKKGK